VIGDEEENTEYRIQEPESRIQKKRKSVTAVLLLIPSDF
jgi:hypothetical protein